jgi:hypothetical protein
VLGLYTCVGNIYMLCEQVAGKEYACISTCRNRTSKAVGCRLAVSKEPNMQSCHDNGTSGICLRFIRTLWVRLQASNDSHVFMLSVGFRTYTVKLYCRCWSPTISCTAWTQRPRLLRRLAIYQHSGNVSWGKSGSCRLIQQSLGY